MDQVVGVKDLRQNLANYAAKVKAGQSFIVVKRSKPLFRVSPVEDELNWETVVDFTKMKKGGIAVDELMKRL